VLTLRGQGEERLWLDAKDRRWDVIDAERRDPDGQLRWRLHHEGFADHGEARLPSRTTVEEPRRHASAQIRFLDVEPNVEVDPALFHLQPPAGIPVEAVGCD
jgi:hypothetical protein